jgi:hypothetical protein
MDHRGFHVLAPRQFPNRPDIVATFRKVRGEGMAERAADGAFGHSGLGRRAANAQRIEPFRPALFQGKSPRAPRGNHSRNIYGRFGVLSSRKPTMTPSPSRGPNGPRFFCLERLSRKGKRAHGKPPGERGSFRISRASRCFLRSGFSVENYSGLRRYLQGGQCRFGHPRAWRAFGPGFREVVSREMECRKKRASETVVGTNLEQSPFDSIGFSGKI